MANKLNSGNKLDVLRLEDVDSESEPMELTTKVNGVRNVSEGIRDMPNVVKSVELDTEVAETNISSTERSDTQSKGATEDATVPSPSKQSENWTNRSLANSSETRTMVESISNGNQMTESYSTISELETKSESSKRITPLERFKSAVPKVTVGNNSAKTKETVITNELTVENNTAKDQIRRESSISRVPTRMSQRSIDAKIPYTTINIPEEEENKRSVVSPEDSWIRLAIPYLPLWLAVICLLLNMIVPGSGTIISGLCIFTCATSRVPAKYDREPILLMCVNLWVGLSQLFTVTFMLVGWFWSFAWGIRMVHLALERRRELKVQRAREIKERAVKAFTGSKIGW